MTTFIRLLSEKDKATCLLSNCAAFRSGHELGAQVLEVVPESFKAIPGSPFAYWVSDAVRMLFKAAPSFESTDRTVRQGVATADDFRFVRGWWEVAAAAHRWPTFSKGGGFSRFYDPLPLVGNWDHDGAELRAFTGSAVRNPRFYLQPGLTWPLRSHTFCPQVLPPNTVFSTRGSAIFSPDPLLFLGLFSSSVIDLLLRLLSGREGHPQYDMGDISLLPIPTIPTKTAGTLRSLAEAGWRLKRTLDSIEETSLAFVLPAALRPRLGNYAPTAIEAKLGQIQNEIDDIAFDLYGFSDADRVAVQAGRATANLIGLDPSSDSDTDEEDSSPAAAQTDGLLSWAVGVAFGRFDWRLATGERVAPPEPEPFDRLPAKSPGMLSDGAAQFHSHAGILVDDIGHPHDLVRVIEEVLAHVHVSVSSDLRRWIQKDYFPFHLQRYSKSRRKAPIYWPLSTPAGSYTLWVYYPSLSSQTLYTAINDFVEPKLKQVGDDLATLRNKGSGRTQDDERQFEALQGLEAELLELRDKLQEIAPGYKPNHDDGVQITAAPLWPLFRHKPWQKVLKDTWAKLEKGDYDWAHLAVAYWPDRVREKCKSDKSLAIAHGLEDLYSESESAPKKTRGRRKGAEAE